MTYKELSKWIDSLSEDERAMPVKIHDDSCQKSLFITGVGLTDIHSFIEDGFSTLPPGYPIISVV